MLIQPQDEALDAGPRRHSHVTQRLCAATGAVRPVADMLRFVVGPDGAVVPDLKAKLPGRGVWVTATRQALGSALARKAFSRGFKRDVRAAGDLVASTERLLERAALDALAMAHKGGRVVAGFSKVEAALTRDRVVGLIDAADAGVDGVQKLRAALRRRSDQMPDNIAIITTLTGAQLDLALGRSNVVHAALLSGSESETFVTRMTRLDRFRTEALS